jgi:hypothetical protein
MKNALSLFFHLIRKMEFFCLKRSLYWGGGGRCRRRGEREKKRVVCSSVKCVQNVDLRLGAL